MIELKQPWKAVSNSWQYTTIYDADGNAICRLNLEDWGVTEENQDALERRQAQVAELIVNAINGAAVAKKGTKHCIFDTETTGIPRFDLPADDPSQPRLAALHMILLDENDVEERRIDFYVKPDGWTMPEAAAKVNGLTDAILNEKGVPLADVLREYVAVVDAGYVMVAFSAQFDLKIMRSELRRSGMDDRFEKTKNICVMKASTEVCKIERMRPGGGYKQPKLSEACEFFGITNAGAHTAGGDADAARHIFLKLKALGALPEAAVHYAKNAPAGKATALPSMDF